VTQANLRISRSFLEDVGTTGKKRDPTSVVSACGRPPVLQSNLPHSSEKDGNRLQRANTGVVANEEIADRDELVESIAEYAEQ
jgi:hypothetical protein